MLTQFTGVFNPGVERRLLRTSPWASAPSSSALPCAGRRPFTRESRRSSSWGSGRFGTIYDETFHTFFNRLGRVGDETGHVWKWVTYPEQIIVDTDPRLSAEARQLFMEILADDDPLFARLLLWTDRHHNGVSEASELRPAHEVLADIGLAYAPRTQATSLRTWRASTSLIKVW
jgi:hypothetical protein